MNKHLITFLIAVLLLTVGMSGCIENNSTDNDESKFVGTWESPGQSSYSFFSDGTCSHSYMGGTYMVKEGQLVVTFTSPRYSILYDYSFSNDNTTLALTEANSDETTVYTKQ